MAFHGGYVGLAGNKDDTGGSTINFSIWGEDAVEVQPADKKYGTINTRQFTHEGTGWAGRLAYPWKVGTRYQIYVHVRHEKGQTIFSAWFARQKSMSGCWRAAFARWARTTSAMRAVFSNTRARRTCRLAAAPAMRKTWFAMR